MRQIAIAIVVWGIGSVPSLAAAAVSNEPSLLTATELEGGAVATAMPEPIRMRRLNSAMLAALEAEAQVRRVELFLKSGPAQTGDLRVVQTGKPDSRQK